MSKKLLLSLSALFLLSSVLLFTGCSEDDFDYTGLGIEEKGALKLTPIDLPTLTAEDSVIYEFWVATIDSVDREEIWLDTTSLGKFFWNKTAYQFMTETGEARSDVFNLPEGKTSADYDILIITFEPYPDDDPAMARNALLRTYLNPKFVVNEMEFQKGLNTATGYYTLATITDHDLNTQEISGLWFVFMETGSFLYENLEIGLIDLKPFELEDNFFYEGWVYKDPWPRPLSLGKFKNPNYRDLSNPYIEDQYAPLVPGEDFLQNKPEGFEGIDYPFDLVGLVGDSTAVYVTIEPDPDPFPNEPFPLMILSRNLPLKNDTTENSKNQTHRIVRMGNRYTTLPKIEVTRADPVR